MDMHPDLRILIIDDNPDIHLDFIKILSIKKSSTAKMNEVKSALFGETEALPQFPKFRLDTALQGLEGVELVKKAKNTGDRYAVAFVDVRMPPGMDGIETVKEIWEVDPDIQVVICTAYSDYSHEKIIETLGQKENLLILKKPFDHIAVRQLSIALTKKWMMLQADRAHGKELEDKIQEKTKLLQFEVLHDALTKLPNRRFFMEFIDDLIVKSNHTLSKFALFFIDLDRFKLINDSFSHATGDELLVKFSHRIRSCLRDNDFFARLGGDEFVLVLNEYSTADSIVGFAKKLLSALNEFFELTGYKVIVTPSIGIAIFPYDGKTTDELLSHADLAMYRAKELGGNQFEFYKDEMSQESLKRLQLESDLHSALMNNEFFLCYQPEINTDTNEMYSVEALIRWNHPERGVLLPIDFIPLAEEMSLFNQIGEWVLKTACEQNKAWQDAGLAGVVMAVNISTQQFKSPDFVDMVEKTIKETGLDPRFLELELSENIVIADVEAINKIKQLRSLGVSLAIDDFGTGYSNLAHIKSLPFNKLKIDQSFVKNINSNSGDEVIIQAIIYMAKNLRLDVIAEGVETKDQLDFLVKNRCENAQGFYFSKAISADELQKMLTKKK